MGIRVVCPNGHRLHLKTQLAGRRGLCPDCGARFRIPTESSETPQPFAEPPKRNANPTGTATGAPTTAANAGAANAQQPKISPGPTAESSVESSVESLVQGTASTAAGAIPMALPVQGLPVTAAEATVPTPVSSSPSSPANVEVGSVPTPTAATPIAPAGSPVSASSEVAQIPTAAAPPASNIPDPFSEAPQAQWYVQPPTGGRYGPANGDVLKDWIAEGRVTSECLVWRDGWPEWQSASTILGSGSEGALSSDNDAVAISPSGGGVAYRRRKSSKGVGIAMIVILGLACVALLAVLFLLISNGTISLAPPGPAK